MKNLLLPTPQKRKHSLVVATNHYNHLFVAANNFKSKKEFVYHQYFQVSPLVQTANHWDENWFQHYE
jgi:hypothetical protein